MEGMSGTDGTKQETGSFYKGSMSKSIFPQSMSLMAMDRRGMADGSIPSNINICWFQHLWAGGHLSTMATGYGEAVFIAGCLVNHGDGFLSIMGDGSIRPAMDGLGSLRFGVMSSGTLEQ